jgi:hypothetical protein
MSLPELPRPFTDADAAHLRGALLWLRNHYDVGRPEDKARVLARVDAVLRDYEPSVSDVKTFRDKYPLSSFRELPDHA